MKALGSHHMFLARVVAVQVDEALIDSTGTLRLNSAGLLAYSHGDYVTLGSRLGSFGCSVRRKHKAKRPAVEAKHSAVEAKRPAARTKRSAAAGERPDSSIKSRAKGKAKKSLDRGRKRNV